MIEMKFYRDDEYVYINNPDGTTKRVAVDDFEAMFDVDTAELPSYTSSDAGKVLTVNNDGTGLAWGEGGGGDFPIHVTRSNALDKTWNEIKEASMAGKPLVVVDSNVETKILFYHVYSVQVIGSTYIVACSYLTSDNNFGSTAFTTDSENGYPVLPT